MPKQKYKKRKDGRYATTFHGKPVYASTSKELEDKINELNYLYNTGKFISNDKITFKEWSEKWYNINMPTKEEATKKENRYLLDKHIYPAIGLFKIKDIKPFHIKNLLKDMQLKGITTTTNKTLQLIKRILNDAIENDIIYKNVANNIKRIKFEKEQKKPLSLYEDKIFIQVSQTHSVGCFMMILRYCGLRREEIIPLEIKDIDFVNKKLSVNKAVHFNHNQPDMKTTKSRKPRNVDIPNILIPFLIKQIESQKKLNQKKYLFTKKTDPQKMLSESATKRWLESFLYHCNILHEKIQKKNNSKFKLTDENKIQFTFHQLRHSYCTMLYYANVKIKKAQELMGHASADMVYDIYTHLDEERENADDLINEYISAKYKLKKKRIIKNFITHKKKYTRKIKKS